MTRSCRPGQSETFSHLPLASLGVIRDDKTNKNLTLTQTNFTSNTVHATADSGGTAVSSLALAEKRQFNCGIPFVNASIRAEDFDCSANCPPASANLNLTQSGMDGNCLIVDGKSPLINTSMDSSPVLSVSGGCLQFPLSIVGAGSIQCTGPQGNRSFLDSCGLPSCGLPGPG